MTRRLALAVCALVMASAVGCSSTDPHSAPTPFKNIAALHPTTMPSEILGLKVAPEDITGGLSRTKRPYVEGIGMYSMRQNDLLIATFQITRTKDPGPGNEARFRTSIISQVGSSQPRKAMMGDHPVYLTTGTDQRIAFWFRDRYLFVLAVRSAFPERRALLRQMVEVKV
jgi:hypothetical protein